jgi:hypothetical protein
MNVMELIDEMAQREEAMGDTSFLAPCVEGGRVRAKVDGLVRTWRPVDEDFAGWGIFRPADRERAAVERRAGLAAVDRYLRLFEPLRIVLARRMEGRSWLAVPYNRSDMAQRFERARPMTVHLVDRARRFEVGVARHDGRAWWWEEVDRTADPRRAAKMRQRLADDLSVDALELPGTTPEMRRAYRLALRPKARAQELRVRRRLAVALDTGGGELVDFAEGEGHWEVTWQTSRGTEHFSRVAKDDLTVVSAGICLSGLDHHFDLQSLVGVVENA